MPNKTYPEAANSLKFLKLNGWFDKDRLKNYFSI
jgi:hypothetical protein